MNNPISEPPKAVRKFWRSDFGQKTVHALEPSKWWTIIFGIAVIAIVVWGLTIQRQQAKDEATHAAEIVANADGQYHSCVASIPILTKINKFIEGDRIVRDTLVRNALAVLAGTSRYDSQWPIRHANVARLRAARAAAFQVEFPVPTKPSCAALRAKLLKRR